VLRPALAAVEFEGAGNLRDFSIFMQNWKPAKLAGTPLRLTRKSERRRHVATCRKAENSGNR
jgi:hypothetical protein